MSISYHTLPELENVSINTFWILRMAIAIIPVLFLHGILKFLGKICRFLSRSHSSFQSQPALSDELKAQAHQAEKKGRELELEAPKKVEEEEICREDVEMAMGRLGLFCRPEGERLPERLNWNELSRVFEEKEPSLEEVKGAFDVFDENGDGFIEARELQRVLRGLGLSEGSDLERCRRMIGAVDDNGDGRIDFKEFVKFMERTLC